jgi:hypothetical protein
MPMGGIEHEACDAASSAMGVSSISVSTLIVR